MPLALAALYACGATPSAPSDAGPDASDAGVAPADAAPPDACDTTYPPGPYGLQIGDRLEALPFDAESDGGVVGITLRTFFDPCAPAKLLVLRLGAGFCGTCEWHTKHDALGARPYGARLRVVDVVASDRDNFPATHLALLTYRARVALPDVVMGDPQLRLFAAREPLPAYVLVSTTTMRVLGRVSDPSPEELDHSIRAALAAIDGAPAPDGDPVALHDGRFRTDQWDMIHAMTLPGAPPPDPTNAKADDAAAAALGKALFFDATLSPSGKVSCATCHDPQLAFTDGKPQSEGVERVDRNAPPVALAAHARWQFWDGRADTIWMQAAGPIEDAREMGSTRLFVAHRIAQAYAASFQAVWGALPPLGDAQRFPATGKPGDAAWGGMTQGDRDLVTRVLVDVAKSIGAYERTLRVAPNRLDAYVGGDAKALSDAEKDGLADFFAAGCAQCHWGPRLTDDAFHNARFPTGRRDSAPDNGWRDGIIKLFQSELHAGSPWSDAPQSRFGVLAPVALTLGTMKTPTLRGLPQSAPYGHGGTVATLKDVLDVYGAPGLPPGDPRTIGDVEPWLARVGGEQRASILRFLEVLDGVTQ